MKKDEVRRRDICEMYVGRGLNEHDQDRVKKFEELPMQAKALFFSALDQVGFVGHNIALHLVGIINDFTCEGCESPIESIFFMAFGIAYGMRNSEMAAYDDYNDTLYSCWSLELHPQFEIEACGHSYRADFLLSEEYYGSEIEGYVQQENIVIECDGFEYHHSSKEQVNHDNEREMDLKTAGYTVIRFSGSQIYNDPMKCADDVIDYLIAGMNRRHEEYLNKKANEA